MSRGELIVGAKGFRLGERGSTQPHHQEQCAWASGPVSMGFRSSNACVSFLLFELGIKMKIHFTSCISYSVHEHLPVLLSLACPFLLTVIRQGRTGDQGPWRARAPDSQREGPGPCSRTSQPFIPALGPLIVSPPLMPSPVGQQTLIQM